MFENKSNNKKGVGWGRGVADWQTSAACNCIIVLRSLEGIQRREGGVKLMERSINLDVSIVLPTTINELEMATTDLYKVFPR